MRIAHCAWLLVGLLLCTAAPVEVRGQDLQDGDWVIGSGWPGKIWRLRDGTLDVLCESGVSTEQWLEPIGLIVDSSYRAVFLANLGVSDLLPVNGYGLFRCSTLGAPPELLGLFPWSATAFDPNDANGPLPFPDEKYFELGLMVGDARTGGLHLAKRPTAQIDDDVNGGEPQLSTRDAYVFGLALRDTNSPTTRAGVRIIEYDPTSDTWGDGPQVVASVDAYGAADYKVPYMVNGAGDTYSATEPHLGRTAEGIKLEIDGSIGGTPFSFLAALFGGLRQPPYPDPGIFGPEGPFYDDVDVPSPVLCDPSGTPYTGANPRDFSGFYVTYTGPSGLSVEGGVPIVSSDAGVYPAFARLMSFESAVEAPGDPAHYFLYAPGGCTPQAKLAIESVDPPGVARAKDFSTGDVGMLAVDSDRVYEVANDGQVVVEGFDDRLFAIAGVPAQVSTSVGPTLVIRIDSPIDALITAPDGRRLGVDPIDGDVNEMGDRGYDSGPGDPRVYAIHADFVTDPLICPNPLAPVPFAVDAVGTGTGPYKLHAYSIDFSTMQSSHLLYSSTITAAQPANLSFSVAPDGTVFPDRDGDGLANDVETGTLVFVDETDTGSNPDLFDTDGDGWSDGVEVRNGSDPNDEASTPFPPIPIGRFATLAIALGVILLGMRALQRSHASRAALPLLVGALAIAAGQAGAADGVVGVNQARAQAGGVTPGDYVHNVFRGNGAGHTARPDGASSGGTPSALGSNLCDGTPSCSACGDGLCTGVEDPNECAGDCLVCSDAICQPAEICDCANDCGPSCGNGVCDCGERTATCSADCPLGS